MVRRGALTIAALLALPGPAIGAAWSPPTPLVPDGGVTGLTALPTGGFLGTADFGGTLTFSTFGPGAPMPATATYPGGDAHAAQATAGDGTTVVAHAGYSYDAPEGQGASVTIFVRTPAGAISAPDTVTGDRPIQRVAAAAGADGALAVAWTDGELAFLRTRAPGATTFSAPEPLSGAISAVALAYTSAGHLLVAQRREDGNTAGTALLEDRPPGGTDPAITPLGSLPPETSAGSDHAISVATGEAGTAVAWDAAGGQGPEPQYEELMWRLKPADATEFAPAEMLERTPLFDFASLSLVVTPSDQGRAVALAAVAPVPASFKLKSVNRPRKVEIYASGYALRSGGASGQRLSPDQSARFVTRDAANTALAVGSKGELLAAWNTSCPVCDTKLMAAAALDGGSFGGATAVNGLGYYAAEIRAAVDRAGRGAIEWTQAARRKNDEKRPVLVSVANAVADGSGPVDGNPPVIGVKVKTSAADAVAKREVSVGVRCSQRCYVRLSLRGAPAVHAADTVLDAKRRGTLTVKIPLGGDGLGSLKQGIRHHRRQVLVTAGDAQGNITQVVRALR